MISCCATNTLWKWGFVALNLFFCINDLLAFLLPCPCLLLCLLLLRGLAVYNWWSCLIQRSTSDLLNRCFPAPIDVSRQDPVFLARLEPKCNHVAPWSSMLPGQDSFHRTWWWLSSVVPLTLCECLVCWRLRRDANEELDVCLHICVLAIWIELHSCHWKEVGV